MITQQESFESDYEVRKVALEAALRVSTGSDETAQGDSAIIVKNAELFFKFLTKVNNNG